VLKRLAKGDGYSLRFESVLVRASIIELSQLAIRIKIVYLCLVGREREEE
jgi:hypothetical protein